MEIKDLISLIMRDNNDGWWWRKVMITITDNQKSEKITADIYGIKVGLILLLLLKNNSVNVFDI